MKFNKLFNKENHVLLSVIILTLTLIFTGGSPISNILYFAVECVSGVKMPSYNLNYNIALIQDYLQTRETMEELKVTVNDSSKFLNIMNSRGVYMRQIFTDSKEIIKFRVDGYEQINSYFRVLQNLKLNKMVLTSDLLNEEELVVTIELIK